MYRPLCPFKRLIKLAYFFGQNNENITNKDILIIISNSDQKLSVVCQLLKSSLDSLKKKYRFNYKIINLYSYNLPIYKINKKLPKSFISLTKILNSYSNYIFLFPVWYSNVPGVLKNFIDWSGYWGTKKDDNGKLVGVLKGKKAVIIASCWDTRKDYIEKLSSSIKYQLVESVFSFYKIKHLKTLIVQDAHNRKKENLSFIKKNMEKIIILINKTNA